MLQRIQTQIFQKFSGKFFTLILFSLQCFQHSRDISSASTVCTFSYQQWENISAEEKLTSSHGKICLLISKSEVLQKEEEIDLSKIFKCLDISYYRRNTILRTVMIQKISVHSYKQFQPYQNQHCILVGCLNCCIDQIFNSFLCHLKMPLYYMTVYIVPLKSLQSVIYVIFLVY